MESLGEKFQKARAAKNLSIEEAARMTKIRPAKLAEIEAEDFSQFPSLAYAKGFVLIYGKFLNVDVSPYLEAFETSEHVTVDGYSYLQDNPAPAPRRTEVMRKVPQGNKTSLMPLVIGIVVLIAGFSFLKLMMNLRRITPSADRDAQALALATPASALAAETPGRIIAPRALPADSTPAPTPPPVAAASEPIPAPTATPPPPVIVVAPTPPAAGEEEPEIRRAEPVNPADLAKAQAALAAASITPSPPVVHRFDIRPLKKTYVRIVVDGSRGLERWLDSPVQFQGKRIAIKVLDPAAIEVRKNGRIIARGDTDVRLE